MHMGLVDLKEVARDVVDALSLRTFTGRMDRALNNLYMSHSLQGSWTARPLEVLYNSNDSISL